ncbi:MAG TPA: hypothetical protein VE093_32460 [Polyangiaceae bacterium]|jgi:hypothetical protein|nr:hypothetical protein [Polyangiaceae bacterium]
MNAESNDRIVFRKQDTIGAHDAEEDGGFLAECFVDTGDLAVLRDFTRSERIVVGRTGTGKSALLLRLLDLEDRAIEVKPENLALSFISNSTILRFFEELGVNLGIFYKLIWRHAFCVEILRKHFNKSPGNERVSLLEKVRAFFKGGQYASALQYLERWGDRFWEETEYRIKEITTKVEDSLKGAVKGDLLSAGLSSELATSLSEERKAEIIQRAQRVVNDAHVPQLNQILELVDAVLDDEQKKYLIVIDRLDEAWVDDSLRYKLIMALIDTVKDFRRVKRAKVVISIRLDLLHRVYANARTAGFQEEKLQSLYLRMQWTKDDLTNLIDARVNRLFRDRYAKKRTLHHDDILVGSKKGESPMDYMLARTFMRPRDIIVFFNTCIAAAEGKSRISMKDIHACERDYSTARLQSLADEWFSDFPNLRKAAEALLTGRPTCGKCTSVMPPGVVESACLELSTSGLADDDLVKAAALVVHEGRPALEMVRTAVRVFHRVGLLGVKLTATEKTSWFSDSWRQLDGSTISETTSVEVHPMFCAALSIAVSSNAQ